MLGSKIESGRSAVISLGGQNRDWESLARKVRKGKTIATAAEESGIPLSEALEWAAQQSEQEDFIAMSIRAKAGESFSIAMETLENLARAATDDEVKTSAAYDLGRLALAAMKIGSGKSGGKQGDGGKKGQNDLFDSTGPWKLKVSVEKP